MRRFPYPAAPNSWFHLLWTDELPAGATRRVPAFGTELVAERRRSGAPVVRVGAAGEAWPVREQDGMILVHHHAEGLAPRFEIPAIPECSTPGWLPVGRSEWTVRSHVQELIENAADLTHFQYLHHFTRPARLVRFETSAHTFGITIAAPKLVLGVAQEAELSIDYCGMGVAVGRVTGPIRFLNVVTNLPIDEERMRLRFTMFVRAPRVPVVRQALAAVLRWHVRHDVEDELRVLEHKRYLERPALAAGDGPIMNVRRWCRQFYSPAHAKALPDAA